MNIYGNTDAVTGQSLAIRNLVNGFRNINAPYNIQKSPDDFGIAITNSYDFSNYYPVLSINYNSIPGYVVDRIKNFKYLLSANDYTYNLLTDSGYKNVIPFTVPILKNKKRLLIKEKRSFNFLSVINIDKCYHWKSLVRCFYKSFSSSDDVSLLLKIYSTNNFSIHLQRKIIKEIQNIKDDFKDTASIVFLGSMMSDVDYYALFNTADCFIKLEGIDFGYSLMNAIASNLLCIGPSTGVGGELLKKYGGIKIEKTLSVKDVYNPFLSGAIYDRFSEDHICSAMKYVYSDFDKVKEKNLKNRKTIINEYGINIAVLKFINVYKNIFGQV